MTRNPVEGPQGDKYCTHLLSIFTKSLRNSSESLDEQTFLNLVSHIGMHSTCHTHLIIFYVSHQ